MCAVCCCLFFAEGVDLLLIVLYCAMCGVGCLLVVGNCSLFEARWLLVVG